MKLQRQTIKADSIATISWLNDGIIDWTYGGRYYLLNGEVKQIGLYSYAYSFDRCITSRDGQYALIYKNLGTKGLLLKNGEVIREVNRSYYHAETYEYPASFFTLKNGRTFLAHCPSEYNRLDFEDVESGEIITNIPGRKPSDIFHSRLEISSDNRFLLVKGWVWHPLDVLSLYDIDACIADPNLLDNCGLSPEGGPLEICTASFINHKEVLIGSPHDIDEDFPGNHIAIWNFTENKLTKPVKVGGDYGNAIAIDNKYAWDFFDYPKIINLQTGDIIDKLEDIATGQQKSSIIHHLDYVPQIVFNRGLNKVAIKNNNQIEILSRV